MTTELTLHGFCDSRVQALEQAFAANFHEGLEAGASLAMTLQGEPIVDLWAGFADAEETQPWQRDTVVQLFSNAKIMVTLCVLRLIDEGRIALDDPVAKHWPEFGAAGKEEITVREVLVHQARVPGFDPPVPLEDFANWERITALLAEQATWFPPGTSCYHPQTFGLILGELTRRVTGLMLSEFFAREFAQPLDADFQLGLKDKAQLRRTAELVPLDQPPLAEPGSLGERVFATPLTDEPHGWAYASKEMPSGNAIANARALARIGALLAMNGELDGRRYLSREIVEQASTLQSSADDLLLGPVHFGLGLGLHSESFPAPTPSAFHWGGYGGSWLVMDRTTGISCAYAMNGLRTHTIDGSLPLDPRQAKLWRVLREVMAKLGADQI